MGLRDYWTILLKRWWIVALVALVATTSAYGYAKLQQPQYRSTVKLTVTPSRYDYGLTLVIESLLRQYSQRLQTDKMAERVNERLQLDMSANKLRGKVKVSPVSEDYILMLTIDDTEPNRARDIAFAWADEFVKEQQVLMAPVNPTDRIEIQMLDRPTPGVLSFPQTRQLALAALILGGVFGLILAFALEYLDDTIVTPEAVERFSALPVLGVIPNANLADSTGHSRAGRKGTSGRAAQGG